MARLGLFIVTALALLFAGVFIIGTQRRMFTRKYHLKAEFATVSGLLPGAEVRIGGLRQGTIDEIRLPTDPLGKVVVTVSLDDATSSLVKRDSIVAIETEGLLGNKFLAVSFGSPGAAAVRDWDTIASAPPLDMADLLKKTSAIMDTTHSAIQHADVAVAGIAAVTDKINRGQGTLGALVNERTLYNELAATSGAAHATMLQAKSGVTAFQEDMEALKKNFLFKGYFKDRGYQDAADLTRWALPTLPAAAPVKTFTFTTQDLFAQPTAVVLKHPRRLDEAGAWLEANPFGLMVIRVRSGLRGDAAANRVLTQAQALAVRIYLAGRFELDDTRLKTMGLGETAGPEPAREHRVDLLVYADPGPAGLRPSEGS
jgi:phospholipid/cholesterol/gamma-HCH transport system substrate-binding protein